MSPIRVFLVEDEAIIREGLRDGIPWQQYGYTFVGEASDGEQALPLVGKGLAGRGQRKPEGDKEKCEKASHAADPLWQRG